MGDEAPVPPPQHLAATGSGIIQVGGHMSGDQSIAQGGNYTLTAEEAEILELDRNFGNHSLRKNYRRQLEQIRDLISGEDN